jgi:hypothetical protein
VCPSDGATARLNSKLQHLAEMLGLTDWIGEGRTEDAGDQQTGGHQYFVVAAIQADRGLAQAFEHRIDHIAIAH